MNGLSEIAVVWSGEVTRAFKSGRVIVLLILFGLFTGLAVTSVGWVARAAAAQARAQAVEKGLDEEQVTKILQDGRKQLVSAYAADDEALTEEFLTFPAVLLIVFSFSLRFIPFFTALMGFDQIAAEIGPRSIRYLVVRARRSSILLGKFLAQFTILSALTLVAVGLMVLGARLFNDEFTLADAGLRLVKLWCAAMTLSVPYLALTSLCSCLFRQPAVSLVFNFIILVANWAMAAVGDWFMIPGEVVKEGSISAVIRSESWVAYARYASVFHYATDLLHPHWQRFGAAGLAHLGYAMVFLGLAYVVLRRRDL